MSISGRNAVWGSTMTFYRPTTAPGTGGQSATAWTAILLNTKLEFLPITDETRRQIFGIESEVQTAVITEADFGVQPKDGVVVSAGTNAGKRFRVVQTARSRKYLQIGLRETPEAIP